MTVKEYVVDYVAQCRSVRQHTLARMERLSEMKVCSELEFKLTEEISGNQKLIDHIDRELDRYERELGWRT